MRQGMTLLVQFRDPVDPETGVRYTVKHYTIRLKPLHAHFDPIVLVGAPEHQVRVVNEFVYVMYPA